MQEQWTGKNVNLALLAQNIEDFFRNKGFSTFRKERVGSYKISVTSQDNRDSSAVVVQIYGDPNDFVLELEPLKEAHLSRVLGSLAALLGAGSLFLKGLKSEELLQKIERDFWSFAEEAVEHLVGSAER